MSMMIGAKMLDLVDKGVWRSLHFKQHGCQDTAFTAMKIITHSIAYQVIFI